MSIRKALALGLAGLCLNALFYGPWSLSSAIRETSGATHLGDFTHFYVGACLAGTAAEYDTASVFRVQQSITGVIQPHLLPSRLPFYYWILQPLCRVPFLSAHHLWLAIISVSALAGIVLLTVLEGPIAIAAALWSAPLFLSILLAQDDPLLFLILGAGLWMRKSGRPLGAGFLLSLLWVKFHLFTLLPVLFLVKREFRVLAGALCGSAILLISCFAIAGTGWLSAYRAVLLDQVINLGPELMPNLHGIAVHFGHPVVIEAVLAVGVLAAAILAIARARFSLAMAAALLGGILLSHHAYSFDAILLLPALIAIWRETASPGRELALLAMLPFPYWLAGILGLGWIPALVFLCLVLALCWERQPRKVGAPTL